MAGLKLFVSYSRIDRHWVDRHLDAIEQSGFDPWYDDAIRAGSDWRDAISAEIETAAALLFLVSDRSCQSDRCREEIDYALELGIPIIAVHIEEVALPGRLRFRLARRQAILAWREGKQTLIRRLQEAAREISESGSDGPGHRSTATRKLRIAVLPIRNDSGDSELEYLSDGLTEDLINHLGRSFRDRADVLARSSVMTFKGQSVRAISSDLEADAVVEGGIQKDDNRIRFRVGLIRASEDVQLWGDAFDDRLDGSGTGVFDVQDALAESIAGALELPLSLESRRLPGSTTSKAKDAYLKGKFHWYSHSPEDFRIAKSYFEEAIRLDQNYAPAYVGLADAIGTPAHRGEAPARDVFPEAKSLIEKALSIDPESPEANDMRGRIAFSFDHQWEASRHYFERAIIANPSYPDAYVVGAQLLSIVGEKGAALDQVTRGLNLDSHNIFFRSQLGLHLSGLDRFEEALNTYIELPEGFPLKAELLWGLQFRMQNYSEALLNAQKLLGPDNEASDLLKGTVNSAAEYHERMAKLAELMEERSGVAYVSPAFIARLNAHADRHDDTLRWLIQAGEDQDSYAPYACVMPEYWQLWPTEGFRAFTEKIELR